MHRVPESSNDGPQLGSKRENLEEVARYGQRLVID